MIIKEDVPMDKKQANSKSCLQPVPKVIVSCRGKNGEDNALAVAYCCNCSYDPPMVMVGIVPSRHSYSMIKDSGCFVVNLVSKDYSEIFNYLGSHSGRDENKLAKMNVKTAEALKINAPILLDCPVNIECKVVDSIVTGSHEMFVGKVEYVHADAQLVNDKGNIDFSAVNFIS
jgi:flavin reductase (DIM6/NTAB) family NADH-FMN oxidoreductase RutF